MRYTRTNDVVGDSGEA